MKIYCILCNVEYGFNSENFKDWPTYQDVISAWETRELAYQEVLRLKNKGGYANLTISETELGLENKNSA